MNIGNSLNRAVVAAAILATTAITAISQRMTPVIQLNRAVVSGDAKRVKQLLAEGVEINGTNVNGFTALMAAVIFQHKPVVDILLAEGADVNMTNNAAGNGFTALYLAASRTNIEILKTLITNGAKVNTADFWRNTPASEAAMNGRSENLKILQEAGASFRNDLVYSSASGQMESVRKYLDDKADVNGTNEIGWTPLTAAAAKNQPEVVKLLLEKGADVNSPRINGHLRETALLLASENGHANIVTLLLAKKADLKIAELNTKDNKTYGTPLVKAVEGGHLQTVNTLLDNGADPNERYGEASCPILILALERDNLAIIKMLLDKGADPNAPFKGSTSLISAIGVGNAESVKLLLSKGARVSARNGPNGLASLQLARALLDEEQSPQKMPVREQIVRMLSDPDAAINLISAIEGVGRRGLNQ